MVEDPRLIDNTARLENRAHLDAEISAVFSLHSRDEVRTKLEAARIAYGAVNTVADLAEHPALRRTPVETPAGTVEVVAPPAEFVGMQLSFAPVPELGQHSDQIRQEFRD